MFKGSIVALVTPFHQNQVDTEALRKLVEYHIDAGTHALVAAGTTGEAGTLTRDEKLLVIKTVVDAAHERIPVIAGTAENSTQACIELSRLAMGYGAHAVLVMTPAYIKPTQIGLYEHYSHLAASMALPIILYNVPARTACDLLPETVARLSHISNIVGIKEATSDLARMHDIMCLCEDRLDVFSGDDITGAAWLLEGAKGIISVTANIAPRLMAKLCDLGMDKDVHGCLALQERLLPLHRLLFCESNPIPVKWALSQRGLIENELRLPLTPLQEIYHAPLKSALAALDL